MIDIKLLQTVMEEVRDNEDLLDSYSPNQFKSKLNLINHIKKLNILNKDSEIVIFGCWYGSILIPAFYNDVKRITAIDINPKVIGKAKHKIFKDYNVNFITADVFEVYRDMYDDCDLFINTSCENMKSMKEWGPSPEYKTPWWKRFKNTHFAFQSNNMFDVHDSVNCVNNIEEFKKQLPDNAKVLIEDEIEDDRGKRFTLVGKICNE
jgi:SAM-dependent methyltransferase